MLRDLRHAVRRLLQNRAWTAVVVLLLGLGFGANSTLFSAANSLLLQTLSVTQPSSLVRLKWAGQNDAVTSASSSLWSTPDHSTMRNSTWQHLFFDGLDLPAE